MHLSLIIASQDRPWLLLQLLNSLTALKTEGLQTEVIVVAGGSSQSVLTDHALNSDPRFHCHEIVSDVSEGPGVFRNRGAAIACGELLIFVDDDVVLPSVYLQRVVEFASLFPEIGCWGGTSITGSSATLLGRFMKQMDLTWRQPRRKNGEIVAIPGLNLVIRSAIFRETGGFSTRYSFGCEDTELTFRLRESDVILGHNSRQVLFHYQEEDWWRFFRKAFEYGQSNQQLKAETGRYLQNGFIGIVKNYLNWFRRIPLHSGMEQRLIYPWIGSLRDLVYHCGVLYGKK